MAGAVLGVNPFDQPNVAASKAETREVLDAGDALPDGDLPSHDEFGKFTSGVKTGDYVAILAYVTPSEQTDRALESVARTLQERLAVAVTVGYGPRYLHSTGQFHKGGPPKGHFILVVELPGEDLPVPGAGYSFGQLARAQAEGDARALRGRGRPLLRVPGIEHLLSLVEHG